MAAERYDVVVIGAGIVGASCAWRLARRGASVAVVEKADAPATGSTGRSAAGVQVQFTTRANIALSMFSLPFYRAFEEEYGHEIGYDDIGYLLLVPEEKWTSHLAAVERQREMGAPVEVLGADEAQKYVDFAPTGLAGATYGPWDGVLDPHMVTLALVEMGRAAGVRYTMRAPVQAIERVGGGWTVTAGAERFSCDTVVNAAGAWSGQIGRMAGLDVPVGPKRIQIFLSAPISDPRTYPLTIDLTTGVYLRSEGDRVLFGLDNLDQGFGFTEGVDDDWLEHVLLTGVDRFPWWETLGIDMKGSWWGYYGVSPDNSPIIGRHPGTEGWVDACGFSGHGISHAPATGLAVSELVLDGTSHTLDVGPFHHGRFEEEEREVETNVF